MIGELAPDVLCETPHGFAAYSGHVLGLRFTARFDAGPELA
jgi:hypothetical protein